MGRALWAASLIALSMMVSPALAQPTPTGAASATPTSSAAATGLPAVRHLVYQFGYNTKAASEGDGTGTTTFDITGLAADGGMTVNATDDWWMAVHPKQTHTCEVYADGGVTCSQAPYAISAIQIALEPMLGRDYFKALSAGPTSTWKQTYKVRATFAPGANVGFAGQVYTWNCEYTLTGKGTSPEQPPLILIHANGQMKQQGGHYLIAQQKANILFDPRLEMPVYVDELITFIPRLSINSYSIELKLIKY